ncbi:hypothetical protein [Rhizosaccharibacter radicis]|uniref:DUF883 domain-containing protein n=1 Tax=Rhizosaccharibacter radicis TaxID=2782605 RepID=A0ABT1VUJ4_9PROT|nr:hypothetical protein [Acetobacteraceae bacterium KSS12]
MVKPSYMLHVPKGPGPLKRALDQRMIPVLIDSAGAVEGALEKVAVVMRRNPVGMLGLAAAAGIVGGAMVWSRR